MSADISTGSAVTPAGTPLALAALLAGTLVGTVGNNVVNVPLSSILAEFDAPLTDGVFVVVGFLGEGVASCTRPDAQAKSMGEFLRALHTDIPDKLV